MANLAEGTLTPEAQTEALRRRAGMPSSTASIGAEQASSLSPQNPLANEGLVQGEPATGGAEGFSTDMATQRLKQEKGEGRNITDALIQRLRVVGKMESAQNIPQPAIPGI